MTAGVALLAALPSMVARLPVPAATISAPDLLVAIARSADLPYSGYAESVGGLALPDAQQLNSLTDLFGDTTRTRSYRRSPTDWRVDTVRPTGERDLYRDGSGSWSWDFEANTAVRSHDAAARLPRAADLVPAELGRRLLSEAQPSEVSSLAAQRIAGRDAPGLQLVPSDSRSTISSVDVWADPATGIPLRVLMHSTAEDRPVLASSFLDFSTDLPASAVTAFTPPPGAKVRTEQPNDLIAAAQQLTTARTPPQLAGLARRERADGLAAARAVGTYGRGVTAMVAVALPGRSARDLRSQLSKAPSAVVDPAGVALTVGPLAVRLTDPGGRSPAWLLAGTVTPDTLTQAADELKATRGYR